MNKAIVILMAVSFLSIPMMAVCETDGWSGNISAYLGYKDLDKDDWDPVDSQAEIGVLLDFKRHNWPASIAVDYLTSDEYDLAVVSGGLARIDGDTTEIAIGIRKIFEFRPTLRHYIGAGVAYIYGEYEINQVTFNNSDDDAATGFWIAAGLYWTFPGNLQIGIDVRYSEAEIKLFDVDTGAGGFHAGVLFGLRW